MLVVCAGYSGLYYVSFKPARLARSSFLVWLHFAITAVSLVGLTHLRVLSMLTDYFRVITVSMFLFYALVGSLPFYSLILLAAVIKERKTTDPKAERDSI